MNQWVRERDCEKLLKDALLPAAVAGRVALASLFTAILLLAGQHTGQAGQLVDDTGALPGVDGSVRLNFRDVDIAQVIRVMSELTGRNFLVDDDVAGKVTLISPQPVSLGEAYQVFLSILEVHGYTAVPQGAVIKIIPSAEVRETPIPTRTDEEGVSSPNAGDAFVTRLIPLTHARASVIRELLSPLVPQEGSLLAYVPTNTLILTDTASNIARLRQIIAALDVQGLTKVFRLEQLRHADAGEMAAILQAALPGLTETIDDGQPSAQAERRRRRRQQSDPQQPDAAPWTVFADPRTNSLVLIATADVMAVAWDIIARLDVPAPAGRGNLHVYYLSHADAEELAQVLTAQAPRIVRIQDPQADPVPGRTPVGITVTADKPTNSLVVTAEPQTWAIIEDIIRKLDIRRPQVLMEGLIAEVSLETVRDLGVEWHVINQPDGTQVFASALGSDGTGVLGAIPADSTLLLSTPGFLVGVLRNTIRLDIGGSEQRLLDIPVLLRAFQGNANVEVLATPNLVTTDNEEAEIIVGEQRPFLTSVNRIPQAGIVSVSNTFDFRDTGITLRLTPQIGEGNTVRAELFLEITRFLSEPEVGAVTTTKRSMKTTVIVDDGQTIVLGGLIQDSSNEAATGVPLLGGLPLLGALFRQSDVRSSKTNLLIFLTPHVIATQDDVDRLTMHKQRQAHRPRVIERRLRQGQPHHDLEWLLD
ncbi:MAG: type II secretion system secretin GspD [Candidatus Tectomicrobia bacterium]|nr:type II secretion system secretin GspD [Candidatus Tectomicrobia bacterium]